jgi:hypothetical protein
MTMCLNELKKQFSHKKNIALKQNVQMIMTMFVLSVNLYS